MFRADNIALIVFRAMVTDRHALLRKSESAYAGEEQHQSEREERRRFPGHLEYLLSAGRSD